MLDPPKCGDVFSPPPSPSNGTLTSAFGCPSWREARIYVQMEPKKAVWYTRPYCIICSDIQVRMYVAEQDTIPWDTLNVIVAGVTYGGRVTDVWDKRTIASIMRHYFDPALLGDSYRFRYTAIPLRLCLLRTTGGKVMYMYPDQLEQPYFQPRLCSPTITLRVDWV